MASRLERFGYPDFHGKTIVVVDDHQDSLDFMSELLTFCGATVVPAWSTAHARTWLESRVPSVMVSVFQRPRGAGVVCSRGPGLLRDSPRGVPAVAVTAYPD